MWRKFLTIEVVAKTTNCEEFELLFIGIKYMKFVENAVIRDFFVCSSYHITIVLISIKLELELNFKN